MILTTVFISEPIGEIPWGDNDLRSTTYKYFDDFISDNFPANLGKGSFRFIEYERKNFLPESKLIIITGTLHQNNRIYYKHC